MNNNIQCSIESSTASINLNSAEDGIYLTPELEGLAGLPEIRTSSGVNAGYDGGWTSAQNYDARLITLRGVIANPDISLVEQKRRQLASIVGQGRKESLTLHFTTEAGRAYTCDVRTISCEMALQRVLTKQDFIIQLRADNPLIYDDSGGSTAGIINVQKELGGFEIDFELPLAIGGGTDISTIVNEGEASNPTIVLNGALHSPTIVNQTTNQQMQILADLEQTPIYSDQISASGNPISFSIDTEYGGKIEELKLNGNATQQTYSGKNLFNFNNFVDGASGSAIIIDTIAENKLVVHPSSGAGAYSSRTFSISLSSLGVSAGDTITVSMKTSGTYSGLYGRSARIYYNDTSTTRLAKITSDAQTVTFTIPSDATSLLFLFYIRDGAIPSESSTATFDEVMLEKSATATAYEPYTNGPSPNPDYPQDINVVTGEQNVQVVGKNFFDWASASDTANTFVSTYRLFKLEGLLPNTEYTLSGMTFSSTSDMTGKYLYIWSGNTYASSTPSVFISDGGHVYTSRTFTTSGTGTYYLAVYPSDTTTWSSVLSFLQNAQLELGSATTYEPYHGANYEVNLGKNLFNKNGSITTGSLYADGTVNTSDTAYTTTEYIRIVGGTTYTTSGMTSGSGVNPARQYYDASKTFISGVKHNTSNPFTDKAPQNAVYMRDCFKNADIDTIQIEAGSQASSYSAYFTPIELAKIGTYQDYIWNDNGTWKVHKAVGKVVLTGSADESWGYNSNDGVFVISNLVDYLRTGFVPISDYYTGQNISGYGQLQNMHISFLRSSTSNRTVVKNTNYTSAADFKTWLQSHNTTVYYALATPTDTAITEQSLIDQLNAVANAQVYSGENNIMNIAVSPNLAGELEIGYVEMEGYDRDQIIIDSQNQTVTMNGENIYDKIADGSEFITMASGDNKMFLASEVTSDTGYAEVKFKQGFISI